MAARKRSELSPKFDAPGDKTALPGSIGPDGAGLLLQVGAGAAGR